MLRPQRIGIIDIGSNSIRLAIYDQTVQGAYRVIDELREWARLSDKIGKDGRLPDKEIEHLGSILKRFKMLCDAHRATVIRAVATAAIRNARNAEEIVRALERDTELAIEVLSGDEEARLGFVGMINSMSIPDGFLVDVGGGSTEVTLFRDRKRVRSVSFPFGAVNTTRRFAKGGNVSPDTAIQVRRMVERHIAREPWIRQNKGLPLIGIGGTMRTLCKIHQKSRKYSLTLIHNYTMTGEDVERLKQRLLALPLRQRQTIDGLDRERADIIGCGLLILQAIFEFAGCSHYVTSGTGLRDGVLHETLHKGRAEIDDVLEHSVHNLLALHPSAPVAHVRQVNRLAIRLFEDLSGAHGLDPAMKTYLHVASLLYRIGTTVNYYKFARHTFYLMAHSRIDGLTHREIVLCALVASYQSKRQARQWISRHKDLVGEADLAAVVKLGMLLRLAIALDRSETQPVRSVRAAIKRGVLRLFLDCRFPPLIELREVNGLRKDFNKVWQLELQVRRLDRADAASTT